MDIFPKGKSCFKKDHHRNWTCTAVIILSSDTLIDMIWRLAFHSDVCTVSRIHRKLLNLENEFAYHFKYLPLKITSKVMDCQVSISFFQFPMRNFQYQLIVA